MVLCFTFLRVLLNEVLGLLSGCKFLPTLQIEEGLYSAHTPSIQTVFFSCSVVRLLMTVWLILLFLLCKSHLIVEVPVFDTKYYLTNITLLLNYSIFIGIDFLFIATPAYTKPIILYQAYVITKIRRKFLVFCIGWQLLSMDLTRLIEREDHSQQSDTVSVGCSSDFDAVALKTGMCYSVESKIFIYSLLKF